MIKEDEVLIKGLKRGLISAQERFFKTYRPQVFSQCYNILKNIQDTEEAVQTSLFRAITNIKKFNRKCKLESWLYKIAHNECLMIIRLRKQHLRRLEALERIPKTLVYTVSDPWLREEIEETLIRMPKKFSEPFIYRHIDRMTNKEGCKILKITNPAYKSRVHRGLQYFKKAVGYDPA